MSDENLVAELREEVERLEREVERLQAENERLDSLVWHQERDRRRREDED